ncbi:dockerin type I domain-containing protein [bacterium]
MNIHKQILITVLVVIIGAAGGRTGAEDIEFSFDIPTIPDPPVIESVTNSTAVPGSPFTVYAVIKGAEQREVCCKGTCVHECAPPDSPSTCDWSNCEMTDFYGQADPRVVPNPTCIPNSVDSSNGVAPSVCGGKSRNPKLYYYYNGDPTTGGNVDMIYDQAIDVFSAEIDPSTAGLIEDDVISYYIVASDNRGNVISQVPDPNTAPCTTITQWDTDYETPSIANCAMMNSYEKCGGFKNGAPNCASNYSMNDPAGDTCDENQEPDPSFTVVDIIGISGGAGKGFQSLPNDVVVCSRIKFGDRPPDIGSGTDPLSAYVMIFFNPDISDPNPDDFHMTNAVAITFAPTTAGADPNLVKVLWDGNCVTNPNTADPLACKLVVGGSEESALKIGVANTEMKFIAKNALPNGKTILGSSQGVTKAAFYTGNIQLDGGTPFWLTDVTAGYSIMRQNQEVTLALCSAPAQPLIPSPADCINGAGIHEGMCPQSASQPASNDCRITIYKSPDCGFVDEYEIYHSLTDDPQTATLLGTIPTNRDCENKSYTHTIDNLDGKIHYYWLPSNFSSGGCGTLVTEQNKWASTRCTVEDWEPPASPTNFVCATPDTQENKCECTWEADTNADPSIVGFKLWRDDTLLTDSWPGGPGTTEYSYTDTSEELVLGQTYTYKVSILDAGGNVSPETTTACTPEDLAAPGRVDFFNVLLQPGVLALDIGWQAGPESDLAGYNVYKCHNSIPGSSCIQSDQFTRLNPEMIPHEEGTFYEIPDTDFLPEDDLEEYCLWVEACDNCDTAGTCPSTGVPNCSSFNTMKIYTKCVILSTYVPDIAPRYPQPGGDMDPTYHIKITTPDTGGTCELQWNKVCEDEELVFDDCDFPSPDRVVGYYIMRAESPGSDCTGVTVDTNPVTDSMGHLVGTEPHGPGTPSFTDSGLTNGTTYCYRVHAFDFANIFSREEPPPDPVPCTPQDTLAPDPPDIDEADLAESDLVCTIAWHAVSDPNDVTYNVYRCTGDTDTCTSENDFTDEVLSGSTELQVVDVTDDMVEYTYCVTATDAASNESAKVTGASAAGSVNCVQCLAVTPPPPLPVVYAQTVGGCGGGGVEIWWTDSPGDGGGGSYNIYSCTDNITVDPATDPGCVLEATGLSGGVTQENPYLLTQSAVPLEGDYYIAMTYVSGITGAESQPLYTVSAIEYVLYLSIACGDGVCDPTCGWEDTTTCPSDCIPDCDDAVCEPGECDFCSPDCPDCGLFSVTIYVSGAFKKREIQSCTSGDPECPTESYKAVETAQDGVVVEVVNLSNLSVTLYSATSDSDGEVSNISAQMSMEAPDTVYRIRARYEGEAYESWMKGACDNSETADADGYCVVNLADTALDGGAVVSAVTFPYAVDGGGGEVGNPNGDGAVNLFDISEMKSAFGTSPGDTCYKAWADLNLDGKVNLFDLNVIKENMGDEFDTASPDFDPALVKSKDDYSAAGADSCCKTNTCQ